MNRWELKILRLVIAKFGIDYQLAIVQEECAELIQAISKLKRAGNSDHPGRTAKAAMNNLYEEVADVQIMLDQIRIMYPSKAYDTIRAQKIARIEKRINQKKSSKKAQVTEYDA